MEEAGHVHQGEASKLDLIWTKSCMLLGPGGKQQHVECATPAFAQGDTVDIAVVAQVNATAKGKQVVMVTLDSGHNAIHVAREMEAYCPLVTVGAYCIVEVGSVSVPGLNAILLGVNNGNS